MLNCNVQKSGNLADSSHSHSVSDYALRTCSVRYRPLLAARNISLTCRGRRSRCKSRRANRTDRPKIRPIFKFGSKIRILALQDSNSPSISSNFQNRGNPPLLSGNPPEGLLFHPSYNCCAIATPPMGGRRDVAPICENGDPEGFARTYIVFRGETVIASY